MKNYNISTFMRDKVFKTIINPKTSLITMGIVAGVYAFNSGFASKILMIAISLCVVAVSLTRYMKDRKDRKIHPLIYISEIVGSILFCYAYILFYGKMVQDNEINVLFILCSVVFLLPIIVEATKKRILYIIKTVS